MKLEINTRSKIRKFTNMWKLNSTLLNNQWVEEEITRETTKYLETKEKKYKKAIYKEKQGTSWTS